MITTINDFKSINESHYLVTARDFDHLKMLIKKNIEKFGHDCDLNYIDVSNVTAMNGLFFKSKFNGNISKWDTSNVENMDQMFESSSFNQDISSWDVSNVTNMNMMFYGSDFNQDINNWNVSNVKNMKFIFKNCPLENNPPDWYK